MKRFKVFKKLCSLALILSMLVSMIPINVFATTTEGTRTQPPKKIPIIVDGSKTGSLIINKYDGADTSNPLNGVTFNAYKVMDINVTDGDVSYKILDKYQGFFTGKGINSGDDFVNMDKGTDPETDTNVIADYASELKGLIDSEKIKVTATKEATTAKLNGEDGKAVMEGLTLGYYLVVETGYPSHVVEPCAPFFVSIPMTSQNGDEWIYDVEVFPKNKSEYGSVEINKTGNGGVPLGGVTFQLEKQKWNNFDKPEMDGEDFIWENVKDQHGKDLVITTGTNGKQTINNLTRGIYRLKETSVGDNDRYILDDSIYYQFEVVWKDGKLQYTYEDPTIDNDQSTTAPQLTINVKNEKPEINKQGNSDNQIWNENLWNDEFPGHISKDVNWKITTTVPSTIKKLKTYKIIDTLSTGLTFDKVTAGVVVTKGGTELTETSDYTLTTTVNANNEQVLTFTFNKDEEKGKVLEAGEEIVIEYKTRLNENAVIAGDGNPNSVKLVYSNSTTTNSTTETPEDISKVYTGGVNIFKYHLVKNEQGTKTEKELAGAQFQVFASKDDALALSNPIPVLVGENLVTTVTSDTNGIASFIGLAYGTSESDYEEYWVVETKAPAGFNLLKEPFRVIVNANSDELKADSADITKVLNKTGFTLPETGGMGTVIFTVAGLGIMGLAGAAYIALKRKESQQ